MPSYAFTGTRVLPERWKSAVEKMVESLPPGSRIITGACIGVDAFVARIAFVSSKGFFVHTVVPANRKDVDPYWRKFCHSFTEMQPGTTYRDRNVHMVILAPDGVRAIAAYQERDPRSLRSGTWQTVRLARKQGLDVRIQILNME